MNSGASFAAAIAWLKAGYKVRRLGWPCFSYIYVRDGEVMFGGCAVDSPWDTPSKAVLAEDWQLVRE